MRRNCGRVYEQGRTRFGDDKAPVRRLFDEVQRRNLAAADEIMATPFR